MNPLGFTCRTQPLRWSLLTAANHVHNCSQPAAKATHSDPVTVWPDDLRILVDEPVLLEILRSRIENAHRMVGHTAQVLLLTLGFSYATGRYYSEDIAEACHSCPTLRSLCSINVPESATLRWFRRTHHRELTAVLRETLERILGTTGARSDRGPLVEDLEQEAQRRIEAALLADTSTLDV